MRRKGETVSEFLTGRVRMLACTSFTVIPNIHVKHQTVEFLGGESLGKLPRVLGGGYVCL